MEIAEIRRARLKEWFANRSVPENEKSYMSQLMSGKASFGEKAARRIESEYGMGTGYLDRTYEDPPIPEGLEGTRSASLTRQLSDPISGITPLEIAELLCLYGKMSAKGRESIMESVRMAAAVYPATTTNNKRKAR